MANGQINKWTPKAHEKTRQTFAKSKSGTSRRDSREMHAAEEMEESGDGDGQVESEEATEVVAPQRWLKRKSGAADSAVEGRAGRSKKQHKGKQKATIIEELNDDEGVPDEPEVVNDDEVDKDDPETEVSL